MLRDLQTVFVQRLLSPAEGSEELPIVGDSISALARLRIHRRHVRASLGKALAETFATVSRLVGTDYFGLIAQAFIETEPPTGPVLAEYGERFPDFLAQHPSAVLLPYLADIARLDWALNIAFYSPRVEALTRDDLSSIAPEELLRQRVRLVDGASLIRSAFPLDAIWALQGETSEQTVDLQSGGVRLLVFRGAGAASFAPLSDGEAAFLAVLEGGDTLEAAALAGQGAEAEFGLTEAFARFLGMAILLHCSRN